MKTPEQRVKWNAYMRLFRSTHRDSIKKRQQLYGMKHKTEISLNKKQYANDHADEIRLVKMAYREKNKEKIKAAKQKYNKEHREEIAIRQKHNQLLRSYGMTLQQYNDMVIQQEGKCLVCDEHLDNLTRALVVDHNHQTGEVRGLLCLHCNMMLGSSRENVNNLKKGIEYLLKFQK